MKQNRSLRLLALILVLLFTIPAAGLAEPVTMGSELSAMGIVIQPNSTITMNVGDQTVIDLSGRIVKSAKSTKKRVATIDKSGFVAALSEGTSKMTVKFTDKTSLSFSVVVVNPYKPASVGFAEGGVINLLVGQSVALHPVFAPAGSVTTYTWKSSKKKIVSVADGVVTAKKTGSSVITVTTANKIKGSITVNVIPNKVDNISPAPTASEIYSIGANWTVKLKSVEILEGNKVALEFYLLNGLGSAKQVLNFYIDLWVYGVRLVHGTVAKSSAKGKKYQPSVFKVTYPAEALLIPNVDLTVIPPAAFSINGIDGQLKYTYRR